MRETYGERRDALQARWRIVCREEIEAVRAIDPGYDEDADFNQALDEVACLDLDVFEDFLRECEERLNVRPGEAEQRLQRDQGSVPGAAGLPDAEPAAVMERRSD